MGGDRRFVFVICRAQHLPPWILKLCIVNNCNIVLYLIIILSYGWIAYYCDIIRAAHKICTRRRRSGVTSYELHDSLGPSTGNAGCQVILSGPVGVCGRITAGDLWRNGPLVEREREIRAPTFLEKDSTHLSPYMNIIFPL